jgi:hypothetical protein
MKLQRKNKTYNREKRTHEKLLNRREAEGWGMWFHRQFQDTKERMEERRSIDVGVVRPSRAVVSSSEGWSWNCE